MLDNTPTNVLKSVIKILGLTLTVPMIIFLLLEMFNISLTPVYMKGIITKAVEESCNFFAQETYKTDDDSPVFRSTKDILFSSRDVGNNRVVAVSGDFFEHSTQDEIYQDIYYSDDFKNFLAGDSFTLIKGSEITKTNKKGLWQNLDRLACGISNQNAWNIPQRNMSNDYKVIGSNYVDNHVTALNLGVTYLDRTIIEKIAKWNMVANLYRGKAEQIHMHSPGIIGTDEAKAMYDYVMYDGFKVYYNTFKITDIKYTVYDLSTSRGRSEFANIVHVGEDTGAGYTYWKDLGIKGGDERRNVCVAEINYTMQIGYDGITPIKQAIKFLGQKTKEVYGVGGDPSAANSTWGDGHAKIDEDSITTLNSDEVGYDLENYNNKIYYYIVR